MSWTAQEPDDPGDAGAGARRRSNMLRTMLRRELTGAGALPTPTVGAAGGWTVEDLPLGGRLLVSGAKSHLGIARAWLWVRENRKKHHWGALVVPGHGVGSSPIVNIPLEEFASILGELAKLQRQKERDEHAARDDIRRDGRQ